jgi:hypothetical protein
MFRPTLADFIFMHPVSKILPPPNNNAHTLNFRDTLAHPLPHPVSKWSGPRGCPPCILTPCTRPIHPTSHRMRIECAMQGSHKPQLLIPSHATLDQKTVDKLGVLTSPSMYNTVLCLLPPCTLKTSYSIK